MRKYTIDFEWGRAPIIFEIEGDLLEAECYAPLFIPMEDAKLDYSVTDYDEGDEQ